MKQSRVNKVCASISKKEHFWPENQICLGFLFQFDQLKPNLAKVRSFSEWSSQNQHDCFRILEDLNQSDSRTFCYLCFIECFINRYLLLISYSLVVFKLLEKFKIFLVSACSINKYVSFQRVKLEIAPVNQCENEHHKTSNNVPWLPNFWLFNWILTH